MILFSISGCSDQNQQELQISTSPVEIEWKLISNFEPDNKLRAELTLINSGDDPIPAEGWALYFNSIRILDTDSFPDQFNVSHINGYFFKLEPTTLFEPIGPGERREIEYLARFFAIKESDAPEGFYFVFDDESIETVESVTVHSFETEEQLNRSPGDNIPVPTPEFTFTKNERLDLLDRSALSPVTPTPVDFVPAGESYSFPEQVVISHDPAFENEARFLARSLLESEDLETSVTTGNDGDIFLTEAGEDLPGPEAYTLTVDSNRITIAAVDAAGIFYGVQSLRSLVTNRSSDALAIVTVSIADHPAYGYRGMHLDVSRNFHTVDEVKRLLDLLALYKLNKFHFHLTDDEGWRIAIDPLPELTEVGGRRGHTEAEENYMIPVYGSGPDPTPGTSRGSGWYSRDQYMELLRFANERHIEVIPEIDVPGHARAAIIAMEHRYRKLNKTGEREQAERYRLHDPEDTSSYRSVQNYTDNVINVCLESTYRFMDLVIDELIEMHNEADAPLNMIHMGGDEVPRGVWEESPACQTKMEELGIRNVRQLQAYFFGRLSDKLAERGLRMGGWEEVALTEDEEGISGINPDFTETTVPYAWSNVWGSGTEDRAYRLANAGYNVVMSHASNFYFDLAYDKHWKEPGFYWAAMLDTEAPFSFIPFNLFRNATENSYGNPLPDTYFDNKERLNADARQNILGLQGQLWTETVNETGRMEYMVMPRMIGLAERAWGGNPAWGEADDLEQEHLIAWNEFANRLGQLELPRIDRLYDPVNYRIPPPGAVIRDNVLYANVSLPGFTIRYELNGDEPTAESPIYSGPVDLNGSGEVRLAAFSTTGRTGRSILVSSK